MKKHNFASKSKRRQILLAFLLTILLTPILESKVFSGFIEVDLYPYYTEDYNLFDNGYRGFFDYFDEDHITIPDLPGATFYVKSKNHSGPHVLSSTLEGTESIEIPINEPGIERAYILGTGTYLSSAFGHGTLWCDDISHFSFTLYYSDGTEEEVFPINTLTGLSRWSDILHGYMYGYDDVAVGHFPASDWGHYHLYQINVDSHKTLSTITMNDKAGGVLGIDTVGDYSILAVTLQSVPEPTITLPDSINLKSKGVIPVAIITTDSFDATLVDPLSVEFGPNGALESHEKGHIEDVDNDGDLDIVLHFKTQETGIECGDTEVSLVGETFDGQYFIGSNNIATLGCKQKHNKKGYK